MDTNLLMLAILAVMLFCVVFGIHIALALGITSLIGTYLLFGDLRIAVSQLGSASFEVLRDYVFATIPMFILMGEFISRSGAASDLFKIINQGLAKVPGRLSVATVCGNVVFAAVTGSSIASATTFSRISYPQMRAHGYDRKFALGSIAGSSCLGMLIPPSVLLIVWGLLMEMSIGQLFVAGILPGLLLAVLYIIYIMVAAGLNPRLTSGSEDATPNTPITAAEFLSGASILVIIFLVLGGIWGGLFTATEASGVGAVLAMSLALLKGISWREFREATITAAKATAPIMFILLTGAIYARFLALGGIVSVIQDILSSVGGGTFGLLILIALIWLALGAVLDSISIILLTVPIFAPIAATAGVDPLAFAIFGILLIEAGLLTPPFGLLVYTVKGSIDDDEATLLHLFGGSVPYWVLIIVVAGIVLIFPGLATVLI